mmetsp:Transcript_1298/g.2718  ORF Transcript_1298/g.2718 Transcript_1298/m.2718 type:complete len:85 (+) Transcript_1298:1142-1396(+)
MEEREARTGTYGSSSSDIVAHDNTETHQVMAVKYRSGPLQIPGSKPQVTMAMSAADLSFFSLLLNVHGLEFVNLIARSRKKGII